MSQFRKVRILLLLLVLLMVAAGQWLTKLRTTDWDRPLTVALYPINGDGDEQSQDYIEGLTREAFTDIERFFADEAEHYQLGLRQPFELVLGPVLAEPPPEPPADRNLLGVMLWSLKMRYWAWRVGKDYGPPAAIQVFVLYHNPQHTTHVAHSLGLQKGLLGVVNVFASQRAEAGNNLVIAHELLHTVGASDKYDPATNQPLFPIGYAEPDKEPVLPQALAEIMAGRIPLTVGSTQDARGLEEAVIGVATAREIRWLE